jgi:adenosylcobinamide-phosphate synthase
MKFLCLLAALLLEQLRPLRATNPVYIAFAHYADTLERHLNAGEHRHGVTAWLLAVVPAVAATMAIYIALHKANPVLAWAWSVTVLYLTMGFRQFSHYYTDIAQALRNGDLATARERLAQWRGASTTEFTATEVARVSIELALTGSHRHVFGPIAWFIVLGPAGAVLYRMAALLHDRWGMRREAEFLGFGRFSERAFLWLDWVPARLTAISFAIVGNFEDAIYCWRMQALSWTAAAHGIILASGAGALGVRLGDALHEYGTVHYRPAVGTGDEADVDFMQSAVGLMWRALVLWMFLLFILTVAHSLG